MLCRRGAAVAGAIAITALAAFGLPASAPALAGPEPPAVEWLSASYGLPPGAAEQRLAAEDAAGRAAATVLSALGDRAAGAWLDPKTGDLVVGAVAGTVRGGRDPADVVHSALPTTAAIRTRTQLVTRSTRDLTAVKRRLDAHAARHGSGRVASWYVDLPRNVVAVEVLGRRGAAYDSQTQAFLAQARRLGDAVRISHVPGTTTTTRGRLLSGQEMQTDDNRACSVGFHATDAADERVVLTAGHCALHTGQFGRDGEVIGPVAAAHFPVDDFAVVALEGQWWQRPWVYRYGRRPLPVRGHSTALVGSTVCKSGATTAWTCGRIVAHDVTVSYDGGETVYGLTQTSTCSGGGDSGGPLMAGRLAQGMLSGGRSIEGRCLEWYGMENVSYFQPVGEALNRYGLRLLTLP